MTLTLISHLTLTQVKLQLTALTKNLNLSRTKTNSTNVPMIKSDPCKDATIAKFYGLPKIHKDNNPLRPIVSLPGSPTYNLSKYLADILKPLVSTSPHSVKNVNAFLSKIKDIHVEPDEIMISFDVVSLFTSIPLDTARLITEKLLTNNTSWQTKTELNIQDILDLLDLCFQLNSASRTITTDKSLALLWGRHFPVSLLRQ